jgi:hypothetical protein
MTNILVATSCLFNSLIRGAKRYEMFSSRCYRCKWTVPMVILDAIFGANHCKECWEFERDNFDGIQD